MRGLDRRLLLELCENAGSDPRIEDDCLIAKCALQDGSLVELKLTIPSETFYSIPEFVIDLERYPDMRGLPHVGSRGTICTFDTTVSHPDPRKPESGVAIVLERAIKILNDGITGANHEDYEKELDAYWLLASEGEGYLCEPLPSEAGTLYCAFAKKGKGKVPCFASSEQSAIEYAGRLGDHHVHTTRAIPCLFLRLTQPLSFPLPVTCGEWDGEIGRSGKSVLGAYRNFLCNSSKKAAFVMLSVPAEGDRTTVCFKQSATPRMNGFRSSTKRHEAALRFNSSFRDKKTLKYFLQDISQDRLHTRGGGGSVLDGAYAVVGCGSLGSYLTKILADSGASRFLVIDDDVVRIENIARHVCGFEYVGQNKSQAMKALLERSNPNIECTAIASDANEVLEDSPDMLNGCQGLFVTAADAPLEYHFVQALVEGRIHVPIVIMWVESFAMAAHAIVLNKSQDVYRDMFDQELSFLGPVIENSSEFLRREAGCQSSYMPYSGLDVQSFLLDFFRLWSSELRANSRRNYHYVWAGHLSLAESLGMKVSPTYARMADYSHNVERID